MIAGLCGTLAVAAQVYDLLPMPVAVGGALLVGALGTALAVRWDSRGIAALGLLGALLAPVLADAPVSGGTVALLFVAMASAVAVVVWRRWGWLSLLAFLVATPQWVAWLFSDPPLAGRCSPWAGSRRSALWAPSATSFASPPSGCVPRAPSCSR